MKKGLIFLLGIVSFFGINTVSADEIYLEYDSNVNTVKPYIDEIGYENLNNAINENIKYYNENLSNDYPYYFISLRVYGNVSNGTDKLHILLTAIKDIDIDYFPRYFEQSGDSSYSLYNSHVVGKQINFDIESNTIIELNNSLNLFSIYFDSKTFLPYNYYYSNFNLFYKGSLLTEETDTGSWALTYLNPDDTLYIPKYDDSTSYSVHKANTDFLIEPYFLYDENISLSTDIYTTINLNDYSYVILSLKDYTPRDTFTTTMYVKGQLCPTTVYNYGSEEKKDYISGWQSPNCGIYNDYYVQHLNFIRSEDIKNHAVYYLTGYDSSKPNLVKVDTSVYNITYITSEDENKPIVYIDGKNYETLPYSSLTDTAVLTQQNGINNEWTCAKYDKDCILDSSGIDIENLFGNPLETLKTVWSAITSIFMLIAEFILLLPPTMQGFLYVAFGVGIALGIIKILL